MDINITNQIDNNISNSTVYPLLNSSAIQSSKEIEKDYKNNFKNESLRVNLTFDSHSIQKIIDSTIPISTQKINNKTDNSQNINRTDSIINNIISKTHLNDIPIKNNTINITNKNYNNSKQNNKNDIIDSTIINSVFNLTKENNYKNNITSKNNSLNFNITNNISNISSYNKTNNIPSKIIDNIKNLDKKYIIGIEILFPLIILIIFIICVISCMKKRKKRQIIDKNNNIENNGIKFQTAGKGAPYNRIQNTSGFNVGLNPNNLSMSEIKVQNLKDEIHNIITNNSGGSNSSGKRKREKRKQGNNNKMNFSSQEKNKGIQNEIKEEIKQYVIDEHLNNS